MLKKIVGIKNVGRFKNSAGTPNPQLARHTFIVGANGFGKTTVCAVLRSLRSGDASHVVGRKTLGSSDPIAIELLMTSGATRFDGAVWSATYPDIAIFDGVFVAENVHAGEVVDIDQKRNLYRIIIGEDGVRLAALDAELAAHSRTKTSEITAAARAMQPHHPGMSIDAFLRLTADSEIEQHILNQQRVVTSAKEAAAVSARGAIGSIPYPSLPEGLTSLLARTLEDIADDTDQLIGDHLAKHGMTADDTGWIATGAEHTGDTCPFCGQDITGLPLIAAYRATFGEQFKSLMADIAAMRNVLKGLFGDAAVGRLDTLAEQNIAAVEFWRQHCALDRATLSFPADLREDARRMGAEASALLEQKADAPLDVPVTPDTFVTTQAKFAESATKVEALSRAIAAANTLIAAKKVEVAGTDLKSAEGELALRLIRRTRHIEPAATLCSDYRRLTGEKEALETSKTAARAALDTHTAAVVEPYERRINQLLDTFNADFSITRTTHGYPGGVATSSYQLVINNVAIDVGDGRTPANEPSFKNTLSAGDRAALALAFFIANLERDSNRARKIVVFDDPFNSQDAFRRQQTVHEIIKVARDCQQIVVLSHDATFLKQIWDKVPANERVSLTVADQRALGSKLLRIDLERACQGRTATDIDDLQTFIATGAGALLDLVRKMRVVLETYARTTYPANFEAADWLGDIVRRIRDGGNAHPAAALYDELDQINDYTKQYHHGEDVANTTPDQIDSAELTGFARRTLRVVNALQA